MKNLQGITMLPSGEGWAVGWYGNILHYQSGQWSWYGTPCIVENSN